MLGPLHVAKVEDEHDVFSGEPPRPTATQTGMPSLPDASCHRPIFSAAWKKSLPSRSPLRYMHSRKKPLYRAVSLRQKSNESSSALGSLAHCILVHRVALMFMSGRLRTCRSNAMPCSSFLPSTFRGDGDREGEEMRRCRKKLPSEPK